MTTDKQHKQAVEAGDLMAIAEEAGGARMAENVVQVTRSDLRRLIDFVKETGASREATAWGTQQSVLQMVNAAFADLAMAFPDAMKLRRVDAADRAVLAAIAAREQEPFDAENHEGWRFEVWTQAQSDPQPGWEDEFAKYPPHERYEFKGVGKPAIGDWRNLRPLFASREEAPAASGLPQGKPTDAMVEAGMRRMFDEKRYNASWDDVIALIFMDMVKAASAQPCASQGCGTKGAEEWYGDKSPLHQTLCMHPDPCGECDRIAALGIGAQQDGKENE